MPPAQMREDIQELVDDLMERVSWMKDEIGRLEVERKEEEQVRTRDVGKGRRYQLVNSYSLLRSHRNRGCELLTRRCARLTKSTLMPFKKPVSSREAAQILLKLLIAIPRTCRRAANQGRRAFATKLRLA